MIILYCAWWGYRPLSYSQTVYKLVLTNSQKPSNRKSQKRVKGTSCNNAGQIFKKCAQALLNSKHIAIGSFMRKLKSRKDAAITIKAGGRKLTEAYYNAITKGVNYVEQGIKRYELQLKLKEVPILNRLAKKHKIQLIEIE